MPPTPFANKDKLLRCLLARLQIVAIIAFFLFLFAPQLWGQNETSNAILQKLLSSPDLDFAQRGGREVVEVSLKLTLQLVLEFNSAIQSAQLGEQIALSALNAAKNRNNGTLNNSFKNNRTRRDEISPNPAPPDAKLSSINTTRSVASTWMKQDGNGIRYSATFSRNSTTLNTAKNNAAGLKLGDKTERKNPSVSSSLKLEVSVPLWQDWGSVNDLPLLKSQLSVDNSRISAAQSRLQILNTFAETYWDLAGLWKNREVLLASVALSERLVADNLVRAEAGILAPLEVAQSEIQLFRSREQLLEIENRIQDIEDLVKVALNLTELPYGFVPRDAPQVHPLDFQFEEQWQKVLRRSLDLKALRVQITNNEYDLENAYNQDKPNIDLNLSYTQGEGQNMTQSFGTNGDSTSNGYEVGLTWLIPFNDNSSEQIKQKKLARRQLDIQTENTKDNLKTQLRTIERNLNFSKKSIENSVAIRKLAEEALQQELEKQKLGKSSAAQVSQAQQELIAAQSNEIQSLITYEKTYLSLLILTGDIYQQYELPRTL